MHIISRQVKENKIAQLRTKIKDLKLEAGVDRQSEIANIKRKITLLQKEIQLDLIQSNIACIANDRKLNQSEKDSTSL